MRRWGPPETTSVTSMTDSLLWPPLQSTPSSAPDHSLRWRLTVAIEQEWWHRLALSSSSKSLIFAQENTSSVSRRTVTTPNAGTVATLVSFGRESDTERSRTKKEHVRVRVKSFVPVRDSWRAEWNKFRCRQCGELLLCVLQTRPPLGIDHPGIQVFDWKREPVWSRYA